MKRQFFYFLKYNHHLNNLILTNVRSYAPTLAHFKLLVKHASKILSARFIRNAKETRLGCFRNYLELSTHLIIVDTQNEVMNLLESLFK
jgi:hypothetical protein